MYILGPTPNPSVAIPPPFFFLILVLCDRELVMDREDWRAAVHEVAKSLHDWATELN